MRRSFEKVNAVMFTTRRSWTVAVASLGAVLLAGPARTATITTPSFITIADTLANDSVQVTWGGLFTSFTVTPSPNCISTGTAASGSANCSSEALPIVLTGDGPGTSGDTINVNVWDDFVGGRLSDTLSITGTATSSTTVHGVITLLSDVEGGAALTALAGGTNITLRDFVENGLPISGVLGPNSSNATTLTFTSDAEVPEPASLSLLLLGSVLLVVARNRPRTRA